MPRLLPCEAHSCLARRQPSSSATASSTSGSGGVGGTVSSALGASSEQRQRHREQMAVEGEVASMMHPRYADDAIYVRVQYVYLEEIGMMREGFGGDWAWKDD